MAPTQTQALRHALDVLDPPEWEPTDRDELEPHQLPPGIANPRDTRKAKVKRDPLSWDLWVMEAGRGSGKTEAAARYYTKWMRKHPGSRGRIIAPTYDDAIESCIRGPSGLLSQDPELRMVVRPGGTHILWPNGSEALVIGTPTPREVERLRAGGNRHIDWWEEMAANPQLEDAWDQAAFGLRLGDHPHAIASTTPRATNAYRKIRAMEGTVVTKGSMFDNKKHLPKSFIDRMKKKYEGSRLGRQEIYGELLEDVVGALWSRPRIDETRVEATPDLLVIVTAVDPAATSTEAADDTGIITAGIGMDGHAYIFGDDTVHDEPAVWGQRAVGALRKYQGDYIVGEVNNGGEMVKHVILTVDPEVRFESVRASRGKATRAQPVASLWGNENQESQAHIVGSMPELEDQLCTWVPGEEDSPDRLDAMVWAVTEMLLKDVETDSIVEHYEPVKIGADI